MNLPECYGIIRKLVKSVTVIKRSCEVPMSLSLSDFLKYKNIVIQCHDNPDADALACGFALYKYLKSKGSAPRFIYGGKGPVTKPNLVLMTEHLNIPAEFVTELSKPELLVTVDCQYGESNVTHFDAETIATIDHHQVSGTLPQLNDVRSAYGACSTIMYELLAKEGMDINSDRELATALYYGLMTDTGGFSEISHPADKDLRDFAKFDPNEIILFKNSNLSRDELNIEGDALKSAEYNDEYSFGIIEAAPCDPNILGLISDMFLEVSGVNTCLVYSILPYGVKLSVRSCVKEVKAGELSAFIAEGLGGGGGHRMKAGGLLKKELLNKAGISFEKETLHKYVKNRMADYFKESEIIYAKSHKEDIKNLDYCVKLPVTVGFVDAVSLSDPGTVITIRTLEGDVDVTVTADLKIIIGVDGEMYPCSGDKFNKSYTESSVKYSFPGEYPPTVIDIKNAQHINILPFAKSCTAAGGSGIYVRELKSRVKVFTAWDEQKYYLGLPGDYLAVRADDTSDIYVINRRIFEKTYKFYNEKK